MDTFNEMDMETIIDNFSCYNIHNIKYIQQTMYTHWIHKEKWVIIFNLTRWTIVISIIYGFI